MDQILEGSLGGGGGAPRASIEDKEKMIGYAAATGVGELFSNLINRLWGLFKEPTFLWPNQIRFEAWPLRVEVSIEQTPSVGVKLTWDQRAAEANEKATAAFDRLVSSLGFNPITTVPVSAALQIDGQNLDSTVDAIRDFQVPRLNETP